MLLLVLTGEERVANVELVEDAAERPHVNGGVVGDAKDNLWGSVEPTLDVGVDLLVLEAPAAEIDDLDARLVDFS